MLLELKKVTVSFGGLTAVNNLDLQVDEGMIFAIIGPNGAGKTTILNCISRFYTPCSGQISFKGENLLTKKTHKVLASGISRSFQNVELFSKMTVLDNLLVGLHPSLKSSLLSNAFKTKKNKQEEEAAKEIAFEILELFDLKHHANEEVRNLPFGIQKMIDIGRAIISKPKLLLLDEPVAGMNIEETKKNAELITRLRDEFGITILMIEHDMSLVMNISDRIAVMDFGKKIAEGTVTEVQNNPKVIEAYLGEVQEDVGT
ncbi:ABC transporter ATP-binding protein [Neobacillus rhizophilus]|uniref:ABC transporter ATP-binding protein n=1 Tax=Neobacillus rhizophilus TaxID=2833579 RepID=A0A942UD83_9BACI|nr:ABC transporter ATP-binding protein [Neobacillus rhizophilus]MBS4215169.1 ABC transporter ATP-binding protein [Neobacillus rhizophilus]